MGISSHGNVYVDKWTEVSPSGVSTAIATRAGDANIQHVITSFMARSIDASNTITFKTGSRMIGEYTIGATSAATPCELAGDLGQAVSAQFALSGSISITGISIKKA